MFDSNSVIVEFTVSELFNLSMHHSDIFISDKQLNRFGLPHPSTKHKMNQIFKQLYNNDHSIFFLNIDHL